MCINKGEIELMETLIKYLIKIGRVE